MVMKNWFKSAKASESVFINSWFILSVVISVFLIVLLAWHLIYSNNMVESFESQELAIQKVSGDLLRYTKSLEMAANMAAATGDLKWEIEYRDYRARLSDLFETIPELVATSEVQEEIDSIKIYRGELDEIESRVIELVARGEKREAADLLAGWIYTRNQLNIIISTERLAEGMNEHINQRIATEKRMTTVLLWVLASCMLVLIVSWLVTINIWRANVKKKQEIDAEVKYLSFHDSLTGLYNRAYLKEKMKSVDNAENLPISIIMLDFNDLKMVNDTYGHGVGDDMLVKGAALVKKTCREDDILARWGGDEFVILLPKTAEPAVHAISRRIVEQCRNTYDEPIPVSMALGAVTKDKPGEDLFRYFKEAEDLMYSHKLSESRCDRNATINALLKTLADSSYETENHIRRIKDLAILLGEKIGLPESELDRLILLATLHDIGMINVPEDIFVKAHFLTEEEWVAVKKHPEAGYRIARSNKGFSHIAKEIMCHHESWDGSGYPAGLGSSEIPLLSRIINIADAFEVMSSGRPYKKPMSMEEIVLEFKACSGKQFDPALVKEMLEILENKLNINKVIGNYN